jgi:hypothetical protein
MLRTFLRMDKTPGHFSPFPYTRAIRTSDLPPIARHVALTLATYANRDRQAWPTQARLERDTGWARRSINNALNTLESTGWLTRLAKGYEGRATLYRLHVPGAPTTELTSAEDASIPAASPGTPATFRETDSEAGSSHEQLCTPGPATVHVPTQRGGATCTPTPSGEQHEEAPSGSALARPEGVPDDLWDAATPLLGRLLAALPADDATRLVDRWPLLTKGRDFCWQVTALTGTNPRARRGDESWSPDALIEALTAVPLEGVEHPERALYRRLVNLAHGRDAVPPPEDPRRRVREVWAPPPGPVGDAIVALAERLSMPSPSRSA